MAATDPDGTLASEELLKKLTMRPLKALCSAHSVDHGLTGKKKEVVVDRLLKLRKVTVREVTPHLPGAAGALRPQAGVSKRASVAKATTTKVGKLRQYFSGGGRELKCSNCSERLCEVRELTAPHSNHKFMSVSCGRYPRCKRSHKLNDVYLEFRRLLCPRLVMEAHSLRAIDGAKHNAFSLSVDASNRGGRAILNELIAAAGLARLALPQSAEDRAFLSGGGERYGLLLPFAQYGAVHEAATQLFERKRRAALADASGSGDGGGGGGSGGDGGDGAPDPFKLAGLPDLPGQLSLFLHAAGVGTAGVGTAAAGTVAAGTATVGVGVAGVAGWRGEDARLATEGEARLRGNGVWDRLRSYQREGVVRGLQLGGSFLLADEMGLGKTLTALATIAALDAWPCLAIVPAVTRRGWATEVERWLVGVLSPSDVHVVYDQYDALEETRPVPKLVIISPKMADKTHQFKNLMGRRWGCAILDEAHVLTTAAVRQDSEQTQTMMALLKSVPRLLLLSGTPATARLFDAFNLFDVLRPGLMAKSKYDYKHGFFDQVAGVRRGRGGMGRGGMARGAWAALHRPLHCTSLTAPCSALQPFDCLPLIFDCPVPCLPGERRVQAAAAAATAGAQVSDGAPHEGAGDGRAPRTDGRAGGRAALAYRRP